MESNVKEMTYEDAGALRKAYKAFPCKGDSVIAAAKGGVILKPHVEAWEDANAKLFKTIAGEGVSTIAQTDPKFIVLMSELDKVKKTTIKVSGLEKLNMKDLERGVFVQDLQTHLEVLNVHGLLDLDSAK